MKIAVTYDNGNVFQHFGHTEYFKIYNVENNEVISAEVVDTEGSGHEALAEFLSDRDVNVLICGGCGEGAMDAMTDAGIEVISGVDGDTDIAVMTYLRGGMQSAGVNCDHHSHEAEGGCGSSCGGGCSGCSGGCGGAPTMMFDGKNVGKSVKVHYRGTLDDGTQFDASYDRGEPLEFICGIGMMITGFDKACADMEPGEKKSVRLEPEEAYGMPNPMAIATIEIAQLPGSEDLKVGDQVVLTNALGQPTQAVVTAKTETDVTFDTNHPMAGKTLTFEIEMIEIGE